MDQNLTITPLIAEAIILINASKQTRAVVLLYFSPLDPIMQNRLQNLRFCLEITETSFSSFRPLGAWHPFPLSFIFGFICKVVRNYGCFLLELLRATSPSASAAGRAQLWGAVLGYKRIMQTFTSDPAGLGVASLHGDTPHRRSSATHLLAWYLLAAWIRQLLKN